MNLIKKIWLGLAIAPVLLALMSVASPAYATDYTCDGGSNPVPANVTGSVNIALISENCVIDHDVTATSTITIQTTAFAGSGSITTKNLTSINSDIIVKAPNNSITTKQIKAGWNVNVEGGTITVDGSITGHTDQTSANHFPADPSYHGSILLRAQGNISTKTIRMDGGLGQASVKSGGIQIDANMSGAPVEFLIGGASANGVDGDLITISSIGCNTIPTHMEGGVRITNGLSTSQGGIRLLDMSNIKVRSSQSRAGLIILNAQNGTLTLPTGKLNAEGMPGQMGGYIFLAGKTIDMQDGTIISTNQDAGATASDHHINITAETIKFRGTEGLKVLADGNGLTGYGLVYIAPQNAVFSRSNNQLNGLDWTFDYLSANGLLTLDGTGGGSDTAPLVVRADGNGTEVFVAGYPVNFHGGDVILRARGNTSHYVYLGYLGAQSNKEGLNIDITGNFVVDADGKVSGDKGGQAYVRVDQAILKAPMTKFTVRADGPSSGDGDGGVAIVSTKSIDLDLESKALFSANAAPSGTGNATSSPLDSTGPQAVTFDPGTTNVALGSHKGQFKITANGGGTVGNAGTVIVEKSDGGGTAQIDDSLAISASAVGQQGDGGTISINLGLVEFSRNRVNDPALLALGGTLNGQGGRIIVQDAVGPLIGNSRTVISVNANMKVDSGLAETTGTFGGSITIGQVLCQQYKTGYSSWPHNFWTCNIASFLPGSETVIPNTALNVNTARKVELQTAKVQLYVMDNITSWNNFFNGSHKTTGIAGLTLADPVDPTSTVFYTFTKQNGNVGNNLLLAATTDHELGHQLDAIWGDPSQNPDTWILAQSNDFNKTEPGYINGENCSTVFTVATCVDPKYFNQQGVRFSNSEIYAMKFGSTQTREFFCEMFEHLQSNDAEPEKEFALNYFPETKAYMLNAINNGVHP